MSTITREEAWQLLNEYNKEHFHLKHAVTVEGVMRYFAEELGYTDELDFWSIVGLLHDLVLNSFRINIASKNRRFCGNAELMSASSMPLLVTVIS